MGCGIYASIYVHMCVYVCTMWGLSNIPSSRVGGLRRACAELARQARTVWLTMVFAQAHHTKTEYHERFRTLAPTLRRACAEIARSLRTQGFGQIMLYLVFVLSRIVDKGFRTTLMYVSKTTARPPLQQKEKAPAFLPYTLPSGKAIL